MQSFLLVASWFCHNETLPTLFFLAFRQPIGSSVCGYFNTPEKDTINFGLWQSSCANTRGLLDIFRIWGEIWVTNELLFCPRWGRSPTAQWAWWAHQLMKTSPPDDIALDIQCCGSSAAAVCKALWSGNRLTVQTEQTARPGWVCWCHILFTAAWSAGSGPSTDRTSFLRAIKEKKVMVIVCPLVMTVESSNRGRINKWRSFCVCEVGLLYSWWWRWK